MTARYVEGWALGTDPDIKSPAIFNIQDTGREPLTTSAGVGTVPMASVIAGVTVAEQGDGVVHKTIFTVDASVTMTDATTAGSHGSLQLYDFPAGAILFLGATSNLAIARVGTAIGETAAVVGSVGTVTTATDNATLTTTEADLIPSTAATLTAGAGTMAGKQVTAGIAIFDGTSTAKDAFLNFAIPDAGSTGDDALTVTGTVTLVWANLGDN